LRGDLQGMMNNKGKRGASDDKTHLARWA